MPIRPRRPADVASRKSPRQARSSELVSAVLQAAVQVLRHEGANRFTTTRVAAKAGVSVGSIYQYFPNKASILFRLQADEWQRNATLIHEILDDPTRLPLDRLRSLVHSFLLSECDEASVRMALSDAAPLYRDSPEAKRIRTSGGDPFEAFMLELLPGAEPGARPVAKELIVSTLTSVGKQFSGRARTGAEIASFADAMADMFCAYIDALSPAR